MRGIGQISAGLNADVKLLIVKRIQGMPTTSTSGTTTLLLGVSVRRESANLPGAASKAAGKKRPIKQIYLYFYFALKEKNKIIGLLISNTCLINHLIEWQTRRYTDLREKPLHRIKFQ